MHKSGRKPCAAERRTSPGRADLESTYVMPSSLRRYSLLRVVSDCADLSDRLQTLRICVCRPSAIDREIVLLWKTRADLVHIPCVTVSRPYVQLSEMRSRVFDSRGPWGTLGGPLGGPLARRADLAWRGKKEGPMASIEPRHGCVALRRVRRDGAPPRIIPSTHEQPAGCAISWQPSRPRDSLGRSPMLAAEVRQLSGNLLLCARAAAA
mgnify:CR=1 FL=1